MFPMQISTGPSINVCFVIKNGLIASIKLSSHVAKGTVWQVVADCPDLPLERSIKAWMESYCAKRPVTLNLPLDLSFCPPFDRSVLDCLQTIPFGATVTYKEVARLLEKPTASRAVGGACGRNSFPLIIPCHRVLAHNGTLGGFSAGLELKKLLLHHETL